MYLSAAAWAIGRTVVDPLILIVCFFPVETGALIVATGAAVVAGAAGAEVTAADAAAAQEVVGAGVAVVVFVPLSVQPANSTARMSNAARLMVTSRYELLFAFMMFNLAFYGGC
jgi:hypothetical protein